MAAQEIEVPAHAVLSPSSAHRWLICPGSIAASATQPQRGPGYHAAEGTAAHSLLEACLRLDLDPEEFIDSNMGDGFCVTEEMAHAVGQAVDYVRAELKKNPSLKLHIENRVEIGPLIGLHNHELEGTADIILEDGRLCIVIDYKHGAGVYVEVKDNPQLKLYAAGARHRNGKAFFKYRTVIIQPRNYANNGVPFREATVIERDLVDWLQKTVRPAAHAALQPDAPMVAGEHCRWCPAKGSCRTHTQYVLAMAASEFSSVEDITEEIEVSRPHEMTPDEVAAALNQLPILENWMSAVRGYAHELLTSGVPIPGWKLGAGPKRRVWDIKALPKLEGAMVELGIPAEDVYEPKQHLSPAKLEKLLAARKLLPRRPRNGDSAKPSPLAPFIEYTIPNMLVMPESADPSAEGRNASAENDFAGK